MRLRLRIVSSTVAVLPVPGTPDTYRHRPPLLPAHHYGVPITNDTHDLHGSRLASDLLWAVHSASDRKASPRCTK